MVHYYNFLFLDIIRQPEIESSSVDWARLSRFHLQVGKKIIIIIKPVCCIPGHSKVGHSCRVHAKSCYICALMSLGFLFEDHSHSNWVTYEYEPGHPSQQAGVVCFCFCSFDEDVYAILGLPAYRWET